MNTNPDMELKIIEAAIACIEKYGFQDVTVRKIAQEAGANVAAINYYFRTKEQLMERVLEITLKNAFDWSHFASTDDSTPRQRLVFILNHLVEGMQMYPEITRAHFVSPLIEKKRDSQAYVKFNDFLEKLHEDLSSRGAEADPWLLRVAIIQIVSASILGIGLFHEMFSVFAGRDLREPEIRRAYIERLVDKSL